jgi:flagellar protein FliS
MTTELSYRKSAIEGASTIGLMIALFDTLAGDLRRAVAAIHNNDIETRCKELNHAVLVLGQLESWIDLTNGGESAQTLSRFYAYLRSRMMEASINKSANILETQIDMILHIRSAWQQLDAPPVQISESNGEAPVRQISARYTTAPETEPDGARFSRSA